MWKCDAGWLGANIWPRSDLHRSPIRWQITFPITQPIKEKSPWYCNFHQNRCLQDIKRKIEVMWRNILNICLARDSEVFKSEYFLYNILTSRPLGLAFQTNSVRHQNFTNLRWENMMRKSWDYWRKKRRPKSKTNSQDIWKTFKLK